MDELDDKRKDKEWDEKLRNACYQNQIDMMESSLKYQNSRVANITFISLLVLSAVVLLWVGIYKLLTM